MSNPIAVVDLLNIPCTAYEAHGAVCGLTCANGSVTAQEWLLHLCDDLNYAELATPLKQQAAQVTQQAVKQLDDEEFAFKLVLPDDEALLDERAEALGLWAEGFVHGFATAGSLYDQLGEDSQGFIKDLTEISKIDFSDVSAGSSDEDDYQQLVEYVRVGVMLVRQEINNLFNSDSVDTTEQTPTLH